MVNPILHTLTSCFASAMVVLALATSATAQEKFEREIGVRASDVPSEARSFVAACFDQARVRWYKEINLDTYTFEAKIKHRGCRYSIEFDSVGNVEDVEVLIRFAQLPDTLKTAITTALSGSCPTFKFQRLQRQWTGSESALQELIRKGRSSSEFVTRFELVYRCGKGRHSRLLETLFDTSGKPIRTLTIVPRNTDNLDF